MQDAPARQRQLAAERNDLFAAKHELHIIALRVWLAGLDAREKRSRAAYLTWRRGTTWPSPSRFDHGHGGFAALRTEAENANQADKARTGTPIPPGVLDRAEQLKRQITPHLPADTAAPDAFDLGVALRAVLAGPTITDPGVARRSRERSLNTTRFHGRKVDPALTASTPDAARSHLSMT